MLHVCLNKLPVIGLQDKWICFVIFKRIYLKSADYAIETLQTNKQQIDTKTTKFTGQQ